MNGPVSLLPQKVRGGFVVKHCVDIEKVVFLIPAVCNPLLVLGHLENCSKELNHTIQGLNPEEANSLKLDKACM